MEPLDGFDLADFRRIDIDMGEVACFRSEFLHLTRYAIVKAGADRDQEIAIHNGIIGVGHPVHSQHMQGQRIGCIDRAYAHQRCHDRDLEQAGELAQLRRGISADNAAARADEGPFASPEQVKEISALLFGQPGFCQRLHPVFITPEMKNAFALENAFPILNILRHVDHHRSGPSASRDCKGRPHRHFKLLRILDEKNVFGTRAHEVEYRSFLERVCADGIAGDLSADQHHRNGVRHAISDWSHAVGGCRS